MRKIASMKKKRSGMSIETMPTDPNMRVTNLVERFGDQIEWFLKSCQGIQWTKAWVNRLEQQRFWVNGLLFGRFDQHSLITPPAVLQDHIVAYFKLGSFAECLTPQHVAFAEKYKVDLKARRAQKTKKGDGFGEQQAAKLDKAAKVFRELKSQGYELSGKIVVKSDKGSRTIAAAGEVL